MKSINITSARNKIYQLVKDVCDSSEPILITSKSGNAYLVSDEDWTAVQETLYLLNIPNMREKLIKGMQSDVNVCVSEDDLNW